MSKRKAQPAGSKRRVSIDKLLGYWIDLSKRPTLTYEDFREFLRMTEETLHYFRQNYDSYVERDKFLQGRSLLIYWPELYFKEVYKTQQITDREYALMRDTAKKSISRIKKYFGQQLALSHFEKTPFQDAEDLISSSTKLTYRWAAGIIASNHIATLLIGLSNFKKGAKFKDDINTLYENLKKTKTKNSKLGRFLVKSYRRFEDANKTRNRCAHVNEGEPTRQEIEQSISLGRLLQRFV
jgi:hypothetical protein